MIYKTTVKIEDNMSHDLVDLGLCLSHQTIFPTTEKSIQTRMLWLHIIHLMTWKSNFDMKPEARGK